MSHAIGWAGRTVAALGLAGVVLALPPAGAVAAGAELQLAQAGKPVAAPAAGARDAQTERQIADLRNRLHITPAQQPQFDAFVKVMQQNTEEMATVMQKYAPGRQSNALDQLRAQANAAATQAEGLKRLVPVFQALYESFSAQQKRTADEVFTAPPPKQPPRR